MSQPKAQAWRRWGLRLLAASVLAPLVSMGTLLHFYLKDEIEQRRTLAFMNFEQQAYRIKDMLRDESRHFLDRVDGAWQLRFTREPRALLLMNGRQLQPVRGQVTPEELKQLNQKTEHHTELETLKIQGQLVIVTHVRLDHPTQFADKDLKPGLYRALWNLDASFLPRNLPDNTQRLYIINQDAALIYSSVPEDTEELILKQPLVQEFIRSPLSRAGTPLRVTRDGGEYGFYMAIPDSNLTFFVESSSALYFAPLLVPATIALGLLLGFMGLTVMVWRSTVSSLQDEVQRLAHSLDEFSKGYLIPTQLTPQTFLLELRPLVESINKNTRGVRERVDLMEKQKK
ncbi:hypothetical protein [Oligoflexus tunisiensis]|uniref:hypothetical protein n=1 Tax=Oligoflexus tunisiensis TaxID=708132 RepID=UPI00114C9F32|nr:hypothetical protein [Oligoflexus tunisiensis]